jgi:hypothetical protein
MKYHEALMFAIVFTMGFCFALYHVCNDGGWLHLALLICSTGTLVALFFMKEKDEC